MLYLTMQTNISQLIFLKSQVFLKVLQKTRFSLSYLKQMDQTLTLLNQKISYYH